MSVEFCLSEWSPNRGASPHWTEIVMIVKCEVSQRTEWRFTNWHLPLNEVPNQLLTVSDIQSYHATWHTCWCLARCHLQNRVYCILSAMVSSVCMICIFWELTGFIRESHVVFRRTCHSCFIVPFDQYMEAMMNDYSIGKKFKMQFEDEACGEQRWITWGSSASYVFPFASWSKQKLWMILTGLEEQ